MSRGGNQTNQQKSKCLVYNLDLKRQVEKALLFVIFEVLLDREMHNTGVHNHAWFWCLLSWITKGLSPQTCCQSKKFFWHYYPVRNFKTLH